MNYVIIITVCVFVVLLLVYRIIQLTEMLQDANEIIEKRQLKIDCDTIRITRLTGKLAESNDKIESLQVINDQQVLTIRDFQIVTGSTYVNTAKIIYHDASTETIKKAIIRDAKGHFIKH